MTPVSLQDPEVEVLDAGVCAVAVDELKELHQEALVPRQGRFASPLIAKLL